MWRLIGLVYRKEMLETLRDRRTLLVMVLLPLLLYPLVAVGVMQWMSVRVVEVRERASVVGVTGPSWPELQERLSRDKKLRVLEDARDKDLREGTVDVLLRLPKDLAHALKQDGSVAVQLSIDSSRTGSDLASERLRRVLRKVGRRIVEQRLRDHGLSPRFVKPIVIHEQEAGPGPQQPVEKALASVLPLLVVLMVLLGGFYPAIDLTAGEKERGTLETLLSTPAPRMALITGKFFVVASIAMLTGTVNLASIGLTIFIGLGDALRTAGLLPALSASVVLKVLVGLVPTSLFFAALLMVVASLARSFKEAQGFLTPLYLAVIVPVVAAQAPDARLTYGSALVPAVNVSLVMRDLLQGETSVGPLLVALVASALYALLALRAASLIYDSERVLFADQQREALSDRPSGWRMARRVATIGETLLLMMGVMVLVLFVGLRLQTTDLSSGVLLTEWLLVALPVLLFLRGTGVPLRPALSLHRASRRALSGAILAGLSGWYVVASLVEQVQQRFLPMPKEMLEELQRTLLAHNRPLALDVVVLAISPAICEELLFRGALLDATRGRLRPTLVVLLNAALFGAFHLSIYRFLPTALLGVVLTLLVLRTGSIVPAMIFHALNNAATLVAGRWGASSASEPAQVDFRALVVSAIVLAIGLWLALARGAKRPPDLHRQRGGREASA